MLGCLQRVGRFEVRLLQEVTATFRDKEDHDREEHQEHHHANNIFHGVVGVERNTIERNAIFVLVLLDLYAVGVVGADFVQCKNVHDHQTGQHKGYGDNVQCKEAVERDIGNYIVTANP